jgi:hypothetical protein
VMHSKKVSRCWRSFYCRMPLLQWHILPRVCLAASDTMYVCVLFVLNTVRRRRSSYTGGGLVLGLTEKLSFGNLSKKIGGAS